MTLKVRGSSKVAWFLWGAMVKPCRISQDGDLYGTEASFLLIQRDFWCMGLIPMNICMVHVANSHDFSKNHVDIHRELAFAHASPDEIRVVQPAMFGPSIYG